MDYNLRCELLTISKKFFGDTHKSAAMILIKNELLTYCKEKELSIIDFKLEFSDNEIFLACNLVPTKNYNILNDNQIEIICYRCSKYHFYDINALYKIDEKSLLTYCSCGACLEYGVKGIEVDF